MRFLSVQSGDNSYTDEPPGLVANVPGTRDDAPRCIRGGGVRQAAGLFLLLLAAWLLWSGHTEPSLLVFGVLSSATAVALALRMDVVDHEGHPYRLGVRPLLYLPWLLWQIARANVAVARIILDPRLPISPGLVRIRASQKTDLGLAIHANSITLTPGTLSLDVRQRTILVHALPREAAEELAAGEMDRRVTRLEGDAR